MWWLGSSPDQVHLDVIIISYSFNSISTNGVAGVEVAVIWCIFEARLHENQLLSWHAFENSRLGAKHESNSVLWDTHGSNSNSIAIIACVLLCAVQQVLNLRKRTKVCNRVHKK